MSIIASDGIEGTVQIKGAYENEKELYLVMEYIEGKNLWEWIRKEKKQKFIDEQEAKKIFR